MPNNEHNALNNAFLFASKLLSINLFDSKIETLIYESNLRHISYTCLKNDSNTFSINVLSALSSTFTSEKGIYR